MRLADATWADADALETDLALLPVGSTEQHGPHAPLSTDTITASAVARAGAERYDGEVVVTPTVPVGVSPEHRQFTGSLWVSADTFRDYVRETITSLASHGWDRVVIVNGHGGNTEAIREVAARVTRAETAYCVPFTWFEAVGDHGREMGHGGPLETAMVREHRPDLVREDRVEAAREGGADRWGDWVHGVNLAHDVAEFTDNGVVGDPTDGDAARGADLTNLAGDALADLLMAVAERDPSRPDHK